jgi:hypothetical protein
MKGQGGTMENELERIVAAALAAQPVEYSIPLELFERGDEKVLAEFLRQEEGEKSHHRRFKKWVGLVGRPEKYSRPKKYQEKQTKNFPAVEKKLKARIEIYQELGVGADIVAVVEALVPKIRRMHDMETRVCESVVAYAKQIGDELSVKPIDIVQRSDGRDEVYRRTFRTRDQFEWYNNTSTQIANTTLGTRHKIIERLEPKRRAGAYGLLDGWLVKSEVDRARKNLPSKAVLESFIRAEVVCDALRAERIYGGNPQ